MTATRCNQTRSTATVHLFSSSWDVIICSEEEKHQRRCDEELKHKHEEKECLEQEWKEAEEEEYQKKKELLDAQAKRQQEREKEMEKRQRDRDGNYPFFFLLLLLFQERNALKVPFLQNIFVQWAYKRLTWLGRFENTWGEKINVSWIRNYCRMDREVLDFFFQNWNHSR